MEKTNIVHWDRQGEIGILSISNGKENYINNPDFVDLDKLNKWTSEDGLKGIIIRGIGRNFSAGADLTKLQELAKDENLLSDKMNKGKQILNFIEDLHIPVISVINGVCFGGGLEIALASHIRISSYKALFAFPEINHGLIPGLGGNYRLLQLIGKKAYDIILSADMLDAAKARELGIVDYVSETKDAFDFGKEKLLSMVSDRPIQVIKSAMTSIQNATKLSREEALKIETELFCKLAVSVKDKQE